MSGRGVGDPALLVLERLVFRFLFLLRHEQQIRENNEGELEKGGRGRGHNLTPTSRSGIGSGGPGGGGSGGPGGGGGAEFEEFWEAIWGSKDGGPGMTRGSRSACPPGFHRDL